MEDSQLNDVRKDSVHKQGRKRTHSSTSESSFKLPAEPAKKTLLDAGQSIGEDGLPIKKQKELVEAEERLKMQ